MPRRKAGLLKVPCAWPLVVALAILCAACGRDPALNRAEPLRVVTVAEQPSAQQVAPAHERARSIARLSAVIRWQSVAAWSWAVTARFAARVDHARFVARASIEPRHTSSAPHRSWPAIADGSVWGRLVQCESGGRWDLVTGNGFLGGLQWVLSTWRAYGGQGMPQDASPAEQIAVAERVVAAAGGHFTAWPGCRRKLGLP